MTKVIAPPFKKPKDCIECPCYEMAGNTGNCKIMKWYLGDDRSVDKPSWCPLKPMPHKSIINDDDEELMKHYKQGRNDVIAELNGEIMQNFCEEIEK